MRTLIDVVTPFLLACSNNRNGEHQQHHTYAKRQNVVSGHTADKGSLQSLSPRSSARTASAWKRDQCGCTVHPADARDGRIRNRRNVVAADRTGQAGCHGHDQHGGRCIAEYRNSDRDQDAERAPGGTGGKGQTKRDEEEYRRHEHTDGGFRLHHRGYEAADVEVPLRQTPDSVHASVRMRIAGTIALKPSVNALTELAKGQHLARDVQHKGEQQRKERAEHQRGGRIAALRTPQRCSRLPECRRCTACPQCRARSIR